MSRLAMLADTHLCMPWGSSLGARPTDALFPAFFDQLDLDERRNEYESAISVIDACYREVLSHVVRRDPLMILHLGDMVTGEAERGLGHPAACEQARGIMADLHGIAEPRLCAGGHDLGYGPEGVNALSLECCKSLGPLYWTFEFGDLVCIGICSPLLGPSDPCVERLVQPVLQAQAEFVADTLRANARERWVLFAHSPNLRGIEMPIRDHVDRLESFVFGDIHSSNIGTLLRYGSYASTGVAAACLRRGVLCPSVAPLWNRGGKYLTAEFRDGRFVISHHTVEYPPHLDSAVRNLPFSSSHKAFRYMLTWHARRLGRSAYAR
jgi:hypothetical protein